MRAFSNPIFNPLCPPVLGEIEIWGIPPSPRQEVSCTSFLGISRSLQPPLSPSLGGIWSRGTSFEKLRTGPKPPAEREFPLCASPTSKQFQANVFHTNSHSIGTGVSITTGRSEHLLRPGPGAGAPGYPEKDCIFVLRGADCSQHDRFQRKQEQRDKRSVQTLILASGRCWTQRWTGLAHPFRSQAAPSLWCRASSGGRSVPGPPAVRGRARGHHRGTLP